METIKRRQFLQFGFAFSSVPLAGCGGGAGTAAAAPQAQPTAAPSAASSPAPASAPASTPAPPPAPAPTDSMAFSLSSSAAIALAPFCIGFAFRQGDVPAGKDVVGSVANLQVVTKNRWPDGSLKFAVVAGRADIAAGQPLTVSLAAGTSASGTALALADLKATNVTASVGCGSFGTVSWSGTDWDAPFQSWISGPQMSSWVYRKAVGTDAHLVAWLEVRLFAGGAVEVLPWIENGYLRVAGPTSKRATYTFTLGGTQRFSVAIDLPHHCRTPLVSGTVLSHWLGVDPGVAMHHDTAYLQSTELVPTYSATVSNNAAVVTGLVSTFTPLQQGNFDYSVDTMNSSGYCSAIGLLPQHDVLYLTANSGAEFGAVVRNGYSAGRYGIHYRDETTNKPLLFSSYPTLVISNTASGVTDSGGSTTNSYCPTPTGLALPQWDGSHHPSVGFMAYLLTGRLYFYEEIQFAATLNYLNITDSYRGGANGVFQARRLQTRNVAWAIRTLAQAITATPDSDVAIRNDLLSSFEANLAYYYGRFITTTNNPFGLLDNIDYGGFPFMRSSAWMNDFCVASFGYALTMNLPISSTAQTRFQAFFAWHAQSIVGRLGASGANDFWYVNAAPYTIAYSPSSTPDFDGGAGPWYANWGDLYAATMSMPNNRINASSTDSVLGSAGDGGSLNAAGFWGDLTPAIAYAVRQGVPGAANAYARMISASNYSVLSAGFDTAPVWSVKPAAG